MKMLNFAPGPLFLCLVLLSGCNSTPKSRAPQIIVNACPVVQRCSLPAVSAATNGELQLALERAESAWASCAAVVDTIVDCQDEAAAHD